MISVEDACARILAAMQPLPPVHLPLQHAFGRYAASTIISRIDLPLFDNSAMDGYAVRAEDLKNASLDHPVSLPCLARIAAGDKSAEALAAGRCIRLFTGSILPAGADAVVMQEDVAVEDERVVFREPVKPLENVRLRGEDVRRGALLVQPGEKLNAVRIGLLAATGYSDAPVHRPCKIAILATGNELAEPGMELRAGQIYESNRSMIAPLLAQLNLEVRCYPIVRDELAATVSALRSAFDDADVVISSGGVSVGEFDFVKEAFRNLGGAIDLWRIAMRPGKPFMFGELKRKFLFGLPGNPVSAFVTFVVLVRPAILKMQGAADCATPALPGELVEPIANHGDRRQFLRVRWETGKIHLAGPQKSHMIASLSGANALLDLPAGAELDRGAKVNVLIWDLP